jgi:NhaC family Na+:H+ antiporter
LNSSTDTGTAPRRPSTFLSLATVVALMGMLLSVIFVFRDEALSGGIQITLLAAAALASLVGVWYCKIKWAVIEKQITTNFIGIVPAILMLFLIGSLSGSWMVSGIVPALIYYGLQIMQSDFFLLSCCVLCCIVSLMTGSSWATIATIGVALVGIGKVQGFGEGWVAGAIISGAYFGDKMSPLSDTTVLASSATETPLFTHIRYMVYTTVPSITIALIVFGFAGNARNTPDLSQIAAFSGSLKDTFHITPWLLLVPAATGLMIARKLPSIVVLFFSSILAGIFAIIFQPNLLQEIGGGVDATASTFKGFMMSLFGKTQIVTGNASLDELVATRGMSGMLNTIWLIICAVCFGGAMTANGMLTVITRVFARSMKGRTSTVASTVGSGILLNICTAEQYIAILLNGEMLKSVYREKGYESRLLSRSTEDSATVTSVLIPWSSCGMTQATVLGVATLTYLPYCIFNLVSPLMSILVAATGYKIKQHTAGQPDDAGVIPSA